MCGSEQLVRTHHMNRCGFSKTKGKQIKPITHSLELGVESVCTCSPRSLLHSLAKNQLGSATTVNGGVWQHEAADTPNFQMQTNRPVEKNARLPRITCVNAEGTFIHRETR